MTIAEKAARKAKKICKDDSHGYNNTPGYRTGNPDYACSGFVAACYRKAGIDVPANSYTQTMKKTWKPFGFRDVSDQVNLRTGDGLLCVLEVQPEGKKRMETAAYLRGDHPQPGELLRTDRPD